MQFAAAAIQSIAGALAPAAVANPWSMFGALGPVAQAAGGAAVVGSSATVGAASFLGSLLEGTATVASALSFARAGEIDAMSALASAGDAELEAQLEEVHGLERRNSLRRALLETIGERDVATAASGVDLSFGTPSIARQEAIRSTERALNIDRGTEEFRRRRLEERARNLRSIAQEKRRGGLALAAGVTIGGLASLARRG